MQDPLPIQPCSGFDATVVIPGSKSITNRALPIAALAKGESILEGVLFADDSRRMLEALETLGFELEIDEANCRVRIVGQDGKLPAKSADLFLGNAGTATRFLTAVTCLGEGEFRIDGIERMRERPIGELVLALQQIGADIEYEMKDGYPPLKIHAKGLEGGEIHLGTTLSSQYISALMIAAPYMSQGMEILFDGPVTSWPYVKMTYDVQCAFGLGSAYLDELNHANVIYGRCAYHGKHYQIEPDASNASYFFAAAAILENSRVRIEGIGKNSLQGDAAFACILEKMGAHVKYEDIAIEVSYGGPLKGGDFDFNAIPDMAQTLAVVALFAEGKTVIRDIGNLRVKETDRMAALENELTKLGATVQIDGDDLYIFPPDDGKLQPALIETYDDHRMAMSFAIAGLKSEGVQLLDPACVNKTFPDFFDRLFALTGQELG